MSVKKVARLRRAKRARAKISELRVDRLTVYRSPRHIYAQVISASGDQVLASASTVEKDLREGATGNVDAASKIGALIAERAKAAGVEKGAFALAMLIMVASRLWPTLHVKADWIFKGF